MIALSRNVAASQWIFAADGSGRSLVHGQIVPEQPGAYAGIVVEIRDDFQTGHQGANGRDGQGLARQVRVDRAVAVGQERVLQDHDVALGAARGVVGQVLQFAHGQALGCGRAGRAGVGVGRLGHGRDQRGFAAQGAAAALVHVAVFAQDHGFVAGHAQLRGHVLEPRRGCRPPRRPRAAWRSRGRRN